MGQRFAEPANRIAVAQGPGVRRFDTQDTDAALEGARGRVEPYDVDCGENRDLRPHGGAADAGRARHVYESDAIPKSGVGGVDLHVKAASDIGLERRCGAEQVLDQDLIDDDQDSLEIQQSAFLGGRGQLDELLVLPRQQRLLCRDAGCGPGPDQPQRSEGQDQNAEAHDDGASNAKDAHKPGICNNCAKHLWARRTTTSA